MQCQVHKHTCLACMITSNLLHVCKCYDTTKKRTNQINGQLAVQIVNTVCRGADGSIFCAENLYIEIFIGKLQRLKKITIAMGKSKHNF
jgi:hypothetical protein